MKTLYDYILGLTDRINKSIDIDIEYNKCIINESHHFISSPEI